jgi:hypothetical protein
MVVMEQIKVLDEAGLLGMLCLLKNESPEKANEVKFIKRTTGEERTLVFDFQIEGLIKGTGPTRSFGGKGLVHIRDLAENKIKSFPIESSLTLKTWNGRVYRIQH